MALLLVIVTPMAWAFFVSFEMVGDNSALAIELEPRISEYLSLMMRLIFAFGLAFELPVILLLLARAGLVTHQGLAEKRKIAIVISFVVAAILTPPDEVVAMSKTWFEPIPPPLTTQLRKPFLPSNLAT